MDAREFKGLELAATAVIKWTGTFWLVPSTSGKGSYRVNADATECTCEDFEITGKPCKHVHAAKFVRARNRGTPIPVTPPTADEPAPARPKRPTYKQDWPNYNKAQTNEKRLFLPMLADLCGTVPESPRKPGPGRKPVPLRDALFTVLYKVYSGFSGRRFTTDMRDAEADGHISQAPHYNFIFKVLERDDVGPILQRLVTRSALPLRAVETTFAVDSSGFGSSKFERWFDTKYGVDRKRATWVKTHIAVGVNTHVVTAVEISDAHDSVMLPDLLRATAGNFVVGDVVADKAYLSRANLELVETMGGAPYIPFRSNNVPDRNGETWERLFHQFALRRDDFLTHYHQRSNVESAFSMVKRKFSDSVRSKTPTAMANEVLAKLVCHNVVCCIHEMYELGIDPGFGGTPRDESDDGNEPRIVRFPGA